MKLNGVGEWVTLVGAAEALATTRDAVYQYIRRHHIPTARLGKTMLVRLSDLSGMRQRKAGISA